jgi:hypothetical protein
MDRVLLIVDDIQFNRQLEMTLRKVGFDVESVNNEFSFQEPLLSFNPDYIIVRGNSSRLNVLNVGKKLKESATHNNGKVILIFPENISLSGEDLFKIRSDIILNEPLSTLRVVLYLVSISGQSMDMVKEKLMKYAITDSQFRASEQQLLKNAGITLDAEIENLSNMDELPSLEPKSGIVYSPDHTKKENEEKPSELMVFKDEVKPVPAGDLKIFKKDPGMDIGSREATEADPAEFSLSEDAIARIKEEIRQSKEELPLRIESYNRAINGLDQDLRTGLKKRQTRKEFNQLHKDLLEEKKTDKNAEQELDTERVKFTKALFKK